MRITNDKGRKALSTYKQFLLVIFLLAELILVLAEFVYLAAGGTDWFWFFIDFSIYTLAISLVVVLAYYLLRRAILRSLEFEGKYRGVIEVSPDGIISFAPDFTITLWSPSAEGMFGYTEEEAIGESVEIILTDDVIEPGFPVVASLVDSGKAETIEKRLRRKSGEIFPAEINMREYRTPEGEVESCVSIVRDITERKRLEKELEKELKKEKAFTEEALNSLSDIFVVLDILEPRFIRWNRRLNEVTGYSDEELATMLVTDFFNAEDMRQAAEVLQRMVELGNVRFEAMAVTKEGRKLPYEYYVSLVKDFEGNPSHVCCIARDISERKWAEEEITRLSRRVMEEYEEARLGIAADLHDEVGQSLNAFKIEVDMIKKEMTKSLQGRFRERIDSMDELLEYTSSTIRDLIGELRPPLLDDFGLEKALEFYVEEFSKKTGIKANVDCAGLPADLPKDIELPLFRIAQEALVNVQRHADAKKVKVSLTHKDKYRTLTIKDDGEGFDAEKVLQGNTASSSFGLLGIRERARMLGGEFKVSSKPGTGTTLTVRVPAE